MPRMLTADRIRYPHFAHLVTVQMPATVPDVPKVWDAFRDEGQMSWFNALTALNDRDGSPLLRLVPLSANGQFRNSAPDRIFVAQQIADRFEQEAANPKARLTVESTVLHELVHWGDFKADGAHRPYEAGKRFERRAYGRDITRWWETNTDPVPDLRADRDARFDLPRGIRNNNPGNIIRSNSQWRGLATPAQMTDAQRVENRFCVFVNPVWGIRAMAILLSRYAERGARSVFDFISTWAPSHENKTRNYADFVAKSLNVNALHDHVNITEDEVLRGFIESIIWMENGSQPYADEIIIRAIDEARMGS